MSRVVLLAMLCATPALAERGLMAFSLETGPSLSLSSRSVGLVGTAEYGLAERWAVAVSLGGDGTGQARWLWVEAGPRLVVLQGDWASAWAFVTPQAAYLPSSQGWDAGVRAGLGARYQLLWGLGIQAQLSARWRLGTGWDALGVAGLFIEA